jgi:hypothetical protein
LGTNSVNQCQIIARPLVLKQAARRDPLDSERVGVIGDREERAQSRLLGGAVVYRLGERNEARPLIEPEHRRAPQDRAVLRLIDGERRIGPELNQVPRDALVAVVDDQLFDALDRHVVERRLYQEGHRGFGRTSGAPRICATGAPISHNA